MAELIRYNPDVPSVAIIGKVAAAAMETIDANGDFISEKFKWHRNSKKEMTISCREKATEDDIEMMFDYVSFLLGALVTKSAADYLESLGDKDVEAKRVNPYKSELFLTEFSYDISNEITQMAMEEGKKEIDVSDFFNTENDYFQVALDYCLDERREIVRQHLAQDYDILTVKFKNNRISICNSYGVYIKTSDNRIAMSPDELLKVIEVLSKAVTIRQIQFLNVVPPTNVVLKLMDIFDNKINLLCINSDGVLTLPSTNPDFFRDDDEDDLPYFQKNGLPEADFDDDDDRPINIKMMS